MTRPSLPITVAWALTMLWRTAKADCNGDNVLRALRRFSSDAVPFCETFIQSTSTVTATPSTTVYPTAYVALTTTDATEVDVVLTTLTGGATATSDGTLTVTSTVSSDYTNIPPPYKRAVASTPLPSYVSQYPASRVSSACSCLSLGTAISTVTSTVSAPTFTSTVSVTSTVTDEETTTTVTTSVVSVTTTTTVPLAVTTTTCGSCSATQYVQNPSFEDVDTRGVAKVWATYAQVGTTIADVVSSGAVSGNRLMNATMTGNPEYSHVNLAQVLTLCGDVSATYTLSFYIGVQFRTGGYVNSVFQVSLGDQVVVPKQAVCSPDASSCPKGVAPYHMRHVSVSGISPASCNEELLFMVYYNHTTRAPTVMPPVLIDLVELTRDV